MIFYESNCRNEKHRTRDKIRGHNGQEENAVTDTFCVGKKYSEITTCVRRTMEETVPEKKKMKRNGRNVSQKNKDLYKQREKEFQKKKPDGKTRKEYFRKGEPFVASTIETSAPGPFGVENVLPLFRRASGAGLSPKGDL